MISKMYYLRKLMSRSSVFLLVLSGILMGFGLAQIVISSPSYADVYGGGYGSNPYIPGCKWDRYKFICIASAFNYIDMNQRGTILINPKRKK